MTVDDDSINGLTRVKILEHFANDPIIPVRVMLDETDIVDLLAWVKETKPELLREVIGVKDILETLEKQRSKAEQDFRAATEPSEKQYKKARNNTLYSVIDYLRKALP